MGGEPGFKAALRLLPQQFPSGNGVGLARKKGFVVNLEQVKKEEGCDRHDMPYLGRIVWAPRSGGGSNSIGYTLMGWLRPLSADA